MNIRIYGLSAATLMLTTLFFVGILSPQRAPFYSAIFKSVALEKGYKIEGSIPSDNLKRDYEKLQADIGDIKFENDNDLPSEIKDGSFFNSLFSEGDKIHEIHQAASDRVILFSFCIIPLILLSGFGVFKLIKKGYKHESRVKTSKRNS